MAQIKRHGAAIKSLLGRNIRLYRETLGFSQEKLAEKADISPPYLGALERGEKWPSEDTLAGIANGLQVDPYDLFKPEHIVSQDIQKYADKMVQEIQTSVQKAIKGINQSIVKNADTAK